MDSVEQRERHEEPPQQGTEARPVSWRWTPPRAWVQAFGQPARSGADRHHTHGTPLSNSAARPRRFLATRRARLVAASLLTVLLVTALGLGAYDVYQALHIYQRIESEVHDGLAQLKAAETSLKVLQANPLDSRALAGAQAGFVAAHSDFLALKETVLSVGFAQGIPVVGDQLTSALRLVPLAIEGTQVAILGCQAASLLTAVAANPLDSSARGMLTSDLTTLQADLGAIRALFNQLVGQLDGLQPRDLALDPRLGPLVRDLRAHVPQVARALADLQAVAAVAGPLLGVGAPSHYLLEILDSTELRPGGGFIGSYGFLTLSGGHLAQTDPLSIKDVDLLDKHFQHGHQFILLPPQYHWFDLVNRWSFGDSNLDADFPTDARNAEQLYTVEGGLVPTQEIRGVIAITPWLFQNMLHIVGPVSIPELKTIVTADNLVQQIHYHQLTAGVAAGPDTVIDPTTGTSLRKRFTGLLFQHFLAQLKQAQSQHLGALVHLLLDSVRTKDIQIYLNNPTAEQVLQDYHAASTIDAPAQSDSLLVVDANMAGSKANYFIPQAMDDAVTVEASGTATHHLRLTYTFPTGPNVLHDTYAAHDPHIYVSYVRVYVPPTAKLQSVANWTIDERGSAFGRQVWGGRMFLRYGTHLTLSLVWTVPAAAVAQASGGWIYTAEIQHQAGSIWRITEHVQLPACGHLTSVTPPLTAQSPGAAGMTGTLSEDMHTTVLYDSSRC